VPASGDVCGLSLWVTPAGPRLAWVGLLNGSTPCDHTHCLIGHTAIMGGFSLYNRHKWLAWAWKTLVLTAQQYGQWVALEIATKRVMGMVL